MQGKESHEKQQDTSRPGNHIQTISPILAHHIKLLKQWSIDSGQPHPPWKHSLGSYIWTPLWNVNVLAKLQKV